MATSEQVWRLTWLGRIVAAGFAVALAALAIAWLVAPASVVWLHLLAVLPAAAAFIVWQCARSKVVLTAGSVVICNPLQVRHILLSEVRSVTNLPGGSVSITTVDGARNDVFAVHTPMLAWILGRRSRANELMEAVEDAALASGAPIPPPLVRHARGASAASPAKASPSSAVPAPPPRLQASQAGAGLGEAGPADAGRFPRRSWWPGYRAPEVDALMERIEATLAGTAGLGQAVTADEVRATRFRITRRGGYDPSTVDPALDAYAEELEATHWG